LNVPPWIALTASGLTAPIEVFRSIVGTRFVLRPVQPEDGLPLGAMFRRLSRMAHYHRFHGARAHPTDDELRWMTQVDRRRHVALVVTTQAADDAGELIVADVRYVADADGRGAEFAIVVDDAWQRQGLGERALRALVDTGRRIGLRELHGGVLDGNAPMLSLARRCGFQLACDAEEWGVMRASVIFETDFSISSGRGGLSGSRFIQPFDEWIGQRKPR